MEQTIGKVYLVGAGPGDSKLLTLYAAELIKTVDVVLYDRLVNPDIIDMIPDTTEKFYVGRSVGDDTTHQDDTNHTMLKHANSGKSVLRLKGGDPIIFGRGGEEAEYLKDNDIPFEIIPGITSGIGAATYSGIPLTHRKYASSVVFVTGHEDPNKGAEAVKWKNLANSVDTIVIMMGLSRIANICSNLAQGGLPMDTPVAVIQDGTTINHKMITGTINDIATKCVESKFKAPCIIIVGKVVNLSSVIGWRHDS